jgi:hypothetical protein
MKIRIILASVLIAAGAYTCTAQVQPSKPNGPVNKTKAPNKPPPRFSSPKSDLSAGVSVYIDQSDKVVMEILVTNHGPNAIPYGQRTVTLTVKNKGNTLTFFKDLKIPALKGTAMTAGQQAGSSFTQSHSVPVSWGFDEDTVYEVRISPGNADPQPKNDVAVQVGFNKGKS